MNKNREKIRKVALLSILLAMGIVLNILESFIPLPFNLKIGLANIVGLFALYIYGYKEALGLTALRVLLVSLLRGTFGIDIFFMALAGGIVSITVMFLLKRFAPFGKVVISTIGALTHSTSQILVAILLMSSPGIVAMLPIMLALALPTGILIGILADRFIKIYDNAIKR